MNNISLIKLLILTVFLGSLVACGKTGDLYLPDDTPAPPARQEQTAPVK